MRKYLLLSVLSVTAFIAASVAVNAQAYGPGYMMGPGYGGGYGPGYMMGPGYGGGYGRGYMMGRGYGYDRGYQRGPGYRGQRLCWTETDSSRGYGYYAPCR
jgi:hypothetical protein